MLRKNKLNKTSESELAAVAVRSPRNFSDRHFNVHGDSRESVTRNRAGFLRKIYNRVLRRPVFPCPLPHAPGHYRGARWLTLQPLLSAIRPLCLAGLLPLLCIHLSHPGLPSLPCIVFLRICIGVERVFSDSLSCPRKKIKKLLPDRRVRTQ